MSGRREETRLRYLTQRQADVASAGATRLSRKALRDAHGRHMLPFCMLQDAANTHQMKATVINQKNKKRAGLTLT